MINISYSPEIVSENTNVTLYLTLLDVSNVEMVRSFYCRIAPDYVCYFPALTLELQDQTYSTSFLLRENETQLSGFNIEIYYKNGSALKLPTDVQIEFGMDIAEPVEGIFYYVFDKGLSETSSIIPEPRVGASSQENAVNYNPALFFVAIPLLYQKPSKTNSSS